MGTGLEYTQRRASPVRTGDRTRTVNGAMTILKTEWKTATNGYIQTKKGGKWKQKIEMEQLVIY